MLAWASKLSKAAGFSRFGQWHPSVPHFPVRACSRPDRLAARFALLGPAWCNAMQPRNRVRAFPFRSCIVRIYQFHRRRHRLRRATSCRSRGHRGRTRSRARFGSNRQGAALERGAGGRSARVCLARRRKDGMQWPCRPGMATVLVYSTGHVERPRAVDVPLSVASGTERGHGGSQLEVGPGHQPPGL